MRKIDNKRSSMTTINSKIEVETTPNLVAKVYEKLQNKISTFRKAADRHLTISEKILIGHLDESTEFASDDALVAGKSYVSLNPDRVALQDVTGQMTILQFMLAGLKRTAVPTTVHCDHLIQARVGSDRDTNAALYENNEGRGEEEISLRHSYNESQLDWFRAGSALNILHSTEEAK